MPQYRFVLKPHPPFRLDLTVWALRRRANNEMDRWDGESYRRTLALDGTAADVTVTQSRPAKSPRLAITVDTDRSARDVRPKVTGALERLLGLNVDLSAFYAFAAGDPRLAPLARRFYGFRPPRFTAPFEALVNAFACQQLSLTVGILLLNRLARRFGAHTGVGHAFPTPQELARRRPDSLHALGFSRQKVKALIDLARILAAGKLDLDRLAVEDDATAIESLCALRGVGRWTAEYVLLRGFGRTHVFPGDDVGARNNLGRWLRRSRPLDYDGVQRVLEPWRPYGGLVYMHLLLDQLSQREQALQGGSTMASRKSAIKLKRAYEKPAKSDGMRILVDRLWPRGVRKEDAALHDWFKDLAPSNGLRKWFGHDPDRWQTFRERYKVELEANEDELQRLRALYRKGTVTLVYAARDEAHNDAVVLKEVLEDQ